MGAANQGLICALIGDFSSLWIKQRQLSSSLQQNMYKGKLCLTYILAFLRVNNERAKGKLIDPININLQNKIWQFQKKGKWAMSGWVGGCDIRSYQRHFVSVENSLGINKQVERCLVKHWNWSYCQFYKVSKKGRIWWDVQMCTWHQALLQRNGPSQMETTCRPFKVEMSHWKGFSVDKKRANYRNNDLNCAYWLQLHNRTLLASVRCFHTYFPDNLPNKSCKMMYPHFTYGETDMRKV